MDISSGMVLETSYITPHSGKEHLSASYLSSSNIISYKPIEGKFYNFPFERTKITRTCFSGK
jgi:hypothetical protein